MRPASPPARGKRRRATRFPAGLLGRTLAPRANLQAALVCALLAAGLAGLALLASAWREEAPPSFWIYSAAAGAAALYFAATGLLLSLPPRGRGWVQPLLLVGVAGGILLLFGLPMTALPAPDAWPGLLTADYWPLILIAGLAALPLARWGLHPTLPLRAFLLAALLLFVLVLPEYLGLYSIDQGMRRLSSRSYVLPSWADAYLGDAATAAQRASGLPFLLFGLALLAAWLPLAAALLLRRRGRRRPADAARSSPSGGRRGHGS